MMSDNLSVTHFTFRKLTVDEFESAMYLSLHVFVTCNSSDFDEEGLTNFKRFIYTHAYTRELTIYGAYKQDMLVGVLAVKKRGYTYILVFYRSGVSGTWYRQSAVLFVTERSASGNNHSPFFDLC